MNIAELGRKIKYESHNFYELELDKPLLDKKEFSHSWLTNMKKNKGKRFENMAER